MDSALPITLGQNTLPSFLSPCVGREGKQDRGGGSNVIFVASDSPILLGCIGILFLTISKPMSLNSNFLVTIELKARITNTCIF